MSLLLSTKYTDIVHVFSVPLECHECMDVDVDLDDSISYKATQDIIRSVRGSQSLQNCDHPHITVCEQHDKCATSDITYTGVCKYYAD